MFPKFIVNISQNADSGKASLNEAQSVLCIFSRCSLFLLNKKQMQYKVDRIRYKKSVSLSFIYICKAVPTLLRSSRLYHQQFRRMQMGCEALMVQGVPTLSEELGLPYPTPWASAMPLLSEDDLYSLAGNRAHPMIAAQLTFFVLAASVPRQEHKQQKCSVFPLSNVWCGSCLVVVCLYMHNT